MESEDTRTVAAVLAGDAEAYAKLVRAYQGRVTRYCLLLMRNPVDAEEAAQDVFVKAYQSLHRFRGQASFFTWIGRIAHNHCMDLLRSRSRRRSQSLDEMLEQGSGAGERFAEQPPADDRSDILTLVPGILNAMKPEHREVLVLRELQQLSYNDVAAALGCSLDAVKSRLRRARAEFSDKARHFMSRAGV